MLGNILNSSEYKRIVSVIFQGWHHTSGIKNEESKNTANPQSPLKCVIIFQIHSEYSDQLSLVQPLA